MDKLKNTENLIASLCKKECECKFKNCAFSIWGVLILAIAYCLFAAYIFAGAREDIALKLQQPMFWLEGAFIALTILTSLFLSKLYATPQEKINPSHKVISSLFFAAVIAVSLSTMETSSQRWIESLSDIHCMFEIAIYALPGTLATLWIVKKQAPTFPGWLTAHIVLAYTALGYATIRLTCALESIPAHACTHIFPVIAYALAGYLVGRKILNWS